MAMLPASFGAAEQTGGNWQGLLTSQSSPRAVRRALADYFTRSLPMLREIPGITSPTDAELAEYSAAADELDRGATEVSVADRRFRVYRIISIVRHGDDGPEPPRRYDPDPDPPPESEEAYALMRQ